MPVFPCPPSVVRLVEVRGSTRWDVRGDVWVWAGTAVCGVWSGGVCLMLDLSLGWLFCGCMCMVGGSFGGMGDGGVYLYSC